MSMRDILTGKQSYYDANHLEVDWTTFTAVEPAIDALLTNQAAANLAANPDANPDDITTQTAMELAYNNGLILDKKCPTCGR